MSIAIAGTPNGYLTGHFLVAMPGMADKRFERTVIYLCAHNADGAMGLVINRLFGSITFPELMSQLEVSGASMPDDKPVHYGGPVEVARGFVLHTADYQRDGTMMVDRDVALTATFDVLRAIANGDGPRKALLALGYAGWGPGQLDQEMQQPNGWLAVPADEALIWDANIDGKWTQAIAKLGVDLSMLHGDVVGRA
jgi:putative transcriptional regulator